MSTRQPDALTRAQAYDLPAPVSENVDVAITIIGRDQVGLMAAVTDLARTYKLDLVAAAGMGRGGLASVRLDALGKFADAEAFAAKAAELFGAAGRPEVICTRLESAKTRSLLGVTVELPNQPGILARLTTYLAKSGISIAKYDGYIIPMRGVCRHELKLDVPLSLRVPEFEVSLRKELVTIAGGGLGAVADCRVDDTPIPR